MKRFFFRSLLVVALALGVSLPALADTIRLKDGSVLHGQVVGFKDQQFTILLGAGARGRRSRITVYMEDVESIEFDSTGGASSPTEDTSNTQPSYQPPVNTQPSNNQPSYTPPSPTNRGSSPVPIEIKIRVRADSANNGWTTSGFVVRRGQRIHITASGRVSLGKDRLGNDRWSSPEGIPNAPSDKDRLMSRERSGALIAVIGDDNDDFILIGRDHDFVAQRDGVLFLGVNEGNLSDNSGAFDVVIEAEAAGSNMPR